MSIDQAAGVEPVEPAEQGLDSTSRQHGMPDRRDQSGRPVRVASGLGMTDGEVLIAVRVEPVSRSIVEGRYQLRLGPAQLGLQELSKQVVTAIPGSSTIQRDDEQIRGGE